MTTKLAIIGLVAASTVLAFGQGDPIKDFVVTKKDAYYMVPSDLICGPKIIGMDWSQDGERLVVLRLFQDQTAEQAATSVFTKAPPNPETTKTQVYVWNSKTKKLTMPVSMPMTQGVVMSAQWIAGSSSLLMETRQNPISGGTQYVLMNLQGQTKVLTSFPEDAFAIVRTAHTKPYAALVEYPQPAADGTNSKPPVQPNPVVRFFGLDGSLSHPVKMPSRRCQFIWSMSDQPYFMQSEFVKGQAPKQTWYLVNRDTGTVSVVPPPPNASELIFGVQDHRDLIVESLSAKVAIKKVGFEAPTVVIQPKDGKDDAVSIVTSEGERGSLSPNLSAVFYESQGNAMVRSLVKVPLDMFVKAKDAAARTALLNKAKQVALALIMYASDNDDNLPSNKGNWQSIIDPYLKNTAISDGFNYAFAGGNMSKIESPAETILGFFEGPGGRAIAYTDGHAKWIPNR